MKELGFYICDFCKVTVPDDSTVFIGLEEKCICKTCVTAAKEVLINHGIGKNYEQKRS